MFREIDLKQLRAEGWIKRYLETQADNHTGEIDRISEPFSSEYWGNPNITRETLAGGFFLGGMFSPDDAWVPYEQTAYWIDGMVRTGALADRPALLQKAAEKIYATVENADEDGYLGPDFLKDGLTWAHAVFFRAITALYTKTGDEKLLEALKKHFLRVPLKDVFEKQKGYFPVLFVRDIADIETALWIYGRTGDARFLTMAEEAYAVFNDTFKDDTDARPAEEMRDVTLPGMLAGRKVQRNHGVTYCEICKLPAILYMYTGKEIYKRAAVNAFEKLYRDQMLVDGVNSSTEYLNGNENSQAMHETCDTSDLVWALGYLYMITGDPKYGDRIEEAIFNAGLGAVDDDFTSNQYFSCPNQVLSDDTSNHAIFYRGTNWHSYAPAAPFGGCCAGNVHRFMPNYLARSWFEDAEKREYFAATYAPGSLRFTLDGTEVEICEKTDYPFESTVRFGIRTARPVSFTLTLRVPGFMSDYTLTLNGKPLSLAAKGGLLRITREFADGDTVEITFTEAVRLAKNARGISVKKGALLYALAVDENQVDLGQRGDFAKYRRYALYPNSEWRYALREEDLDIAVLPAAAAAEPWRNGAEVPAVEVTAYRYPRWRLMKGKNTPGRHHPRKGYPFRVDHDCSFTPRVPHRVTREEVGETVRLRLVPYGQTRLRISIFPLIGE